MDAPLALASPGLSWIGAELPAQAGRLPIGAAALAELDAVAALLADNPLPVVALDPADFPLTACHALMAEAKRLITEAPGFVILDRLPIERHGREITTALGWLLCRMLARPVAQKWDGRLVYDVRDTGLTPGNGVRPDITNSELSFHIDNSYNICPPEMVGLICLQTAKAGGLSSLVSLPAAHAEMARRHPKLLPRLYRPYRFDRQREHAPGDALTIFQPIFEAPEGRLAGRISRFQILNGHTLAEQPLDAEGQEALDAVNGILEAPEMRHDFTFQPGQVQVIGNRSIAHKRSGFTDWPEPERKRHLVRLWLRDAGRPFYNG